MAQTAQQIINSAKGADANGLTFAQYLRSRGYRAASPLSFEDWLLKLFDRNKNGAIGTSEKSSYKKALKPENIGVYQTQYAQYVSTLKAQDAATVRQYLAIWQANVGGGSASRAVTEQSENKRKTLLLVLAVGVVAFMFLK